jgi:hypothetical protein
MDFLDFQQETVKVPAAGGDFLLVRGLGIADISRLMRRNLSDIMTIVEWFNQADAGIEGKAIVSMIALAPGLAHSVIAAACGHADHEDVAALLPASLQVSVLKEAIDLTFRGSGGPHDFLAAVKAIWAQIAPIANPPGS